MTTQPPDMLPNVLIALLKGIMEREAAPVLWQGLLATQSRVRDWIGPIGLDLTLDEAEGFAYLRQKPQADGEPELPRLVARRQLSYPVSLMLALLRKKLAEFDSKSGETRLIVTTHEILDMVRLFRPETANEDKLKDRCERDINRIVELGFLRPLKGRDETFEVRRILRAFVDAQWLGAMNEHLAAYATYATYAGSADDGATPALQERVAI